MKINCCP